MILGARAVAFECFRSAAFGALFLGHSEMFDFSAVVASVYVATARGGFSVSLLWSFCFGLLYYCYKGGVPPGLWFNSLDMDCFAIRI